MKKFIRNIIFFFILAVLAGEIVVRITHAMSDIPQRTIDENGIQKYKSNQTGYWKGGDHKWVINDLGWPGDLPSSYEDLVLVMGDSYIENFMNPNECHQSAYLKSFLPRFNYLETARSGVSLIEAMEISKQNDTLNPKHTLLYINNNDFLESISGIKRMRDITQLNLKTNEIIRGEMKSPGFKKILYNWKLLYYFYNRFPLNSTTVKADKKEMKMESKEAELPINEIKMLLSYITKNYDINSKTLVFHPNSEMRIVQLCQEFGFNTIMLDSSNDKDWTFKYDSHWTCYGHEKVAQQVAIKLDKLLQ